MSEAELLMAQVTDTFGHVESEPLVVRLQAGWAHLEFEGKSLMVDAAELRDALEPRREVRAA